ncbi:PGDYG domain-containing protein [Mycobacterium sp. GA-1841]|uniref:PGDYG domain-containing protein n=1 Tax=Mycobacterium sp. GA-1841 TaxID=1834154 RepID=UPI00158EE24E|nr:PGDYG domain-containing protein [Mycobacterium sp. GA-1841]
MARLLNLEEIDELLDGAGRYRSTIIVGAVQIQQESDWTTARGDPLQMAAGDWWVTDDRGDRWSVAADVFAQTYEQLPDGRYRKAAQVVATELTETVTVQTLEGLATAEPGDWLVRNPGGECWPVPAADFSRRYEKV